jgi:molybdopterin/thiamine biosynthesis adenylyltransferase
MMEYFKRQIELWGVEKQNRLAEQRIAIIGSGGLGSSIALALGSVGIGEIHLIDFDRVALHNIHRQIAFKKSDIDRYKSDAVAELLKDRSDYSRVFSYREGFSEWSSRGVDVDLILDATDNFTVRKEIDSYSKAKSIPWVYGSVEAFHGQVCLFKNSSFQVFSSEDKRPDGVSTPIVMQIASFQANLALKYLLRDEVATDQLYYLSFDSDGLFQAKSFKMPVS